MLREREKGEREREQNATLNSKSTYRFLLYKAHKINFHVQAFIIPYKFITTDTVNILSNETEKSLGGLMSHMLVSNKSSRAYCSFIVQKNE